MLLPGETWTFTVPYASPSQNVTDRMHWARKAKLKKQFLWELKVAVMRFLNGPPSRVWAKPVDYRAHLHITRCGPRTLDAANMIGGLKNHIDCYRDLRLIHDDAPQWLCDTYEQKKVKGKQQCTIFALSRP